MIARVARRAGLAAIVAIAGALDLWALTINGYGNGYYAEAALAASKSWTALLTNAADPSGLVSLDKGPLPDWIMGLCGRVFGFSSLSMLLPNALCGIAAVVVLYDLVRRTLGARTALLAALLLAVSPVSVVMARYNNPDALLALLLVGSAWALVRALESGRTRHMLLCGALLGLAFNTKMLEAYLILPALACAFLLAASGPVARRAQQLLAGAGVMLAERVLVSRMAALALAGALLVTALLSFAILYYPFGFVPWLHWVVLVAGVAAAIGVALLRRTARRSLAGVRLWHGQQQWQGALALAFGGGALALLAGPAAYSVATVGFGRTGSSPTAGPAALTAPQGRLPAPGSRPAREGKLGVAGGTYDPRCCRSWSAVAAGRAIWWQRKGHSSQRRLGWQAERR